MNQTFTLEEAIARIQSGVWRVSGGRLGAGKAILAKIERVWEQHASLAFVGEDNAAITIPKEDLHAEYSDFNGQPRVIYFMGPITTMRQRKKADGGGMEETKQIGCVLQVVNREVQTQYWEAIAERQQRANEAASAREAELQSLAAERARRDDEERHSRIRSFLQNQKEQIGEARIADLTATENVLTLKFSNGHELVVELDGGDIWDAWLNIHGGGQGISLCTGKKPS